MKTFRLGMTVLLTILSGCGSSSDGAPATGDPADASSSGGTQAGSGGRPSGGSGGSVPGNTGGRFAGSGGESRGSGGQVSESGGSSATGGNGAGGGETGGTSSNTGGASSSTGGASNGGASTGGSGGTSNSGGTGGSPALPGDDCGTPIPLVFEGDTATVRGTTVGYSDDHVSGKCPTGEFNGDLVYELTLAAASNVTAKVTANQFSPLVSVHSGAPTCAEASAVAHEHSCSKTGVSSSVTATSVNLPAGTHWVWVDGYAGSGSYSLVVTQVLAGRCATQIPLTFANGAVSITDTTVDGENIIKTCSGTGQEKAFTFQQSRNGRFTAQATATSNGYRPVLNLMATCTPSTAGPFTCAHPDVGGAPTSLSTTLTAGTYSLIVDGYDTTSGSFTLTATQADLPGDTCANAVAITPGTLNDQTNVGYNNDISPAYLDRNCSDIPSGQYNAADRVYSIVVPAGKTLTAVATGVNPTPTANVALYLLRSATFCVNRPADCIGSDNAVSGAETVTYTNYDTAPATVFLIVDSGNTVQFNFSLTTTIE